MFGMGMKSFRIFLLIFITVAISACGTAMYGPDNTAFGTGHTGYSEKPIDSVTYQVTYWSRNSDDADRYDLYRSAELTNQHGFDYFVVSDSRPNDNADLSEYEVTKTIRMYKGETPTDNASAYNAKSMLTVMGPTVNK
jgi:hypothetical protein